MINIKTEQICSCGFSMCEVCITKSLYKPFKEKKTDSKCSGCEKPLGDLERFKEFFSDQIKKEEKEQCEKDR